jgi:hypothetical protein
MLYIKGRIMRATDVSKRLHILLVVGFFIIPLFPVIGRDMVEPQCVADPLTTITDETFALFPSGYGEFIFINHLFKNSDEDAFYFGVLGAFTAFNLLNVVALGGYYSCYNLIGPFNEGDPVVNIGRW